jgi:SAM-dependent methyltransferase
MAACPVCPSKNTTMLISVGNYDYLTCNCCRSAFLELVNQDEQIKGHSGAEYKEARIAVESQHGLHNKWLAEYILDKKPSGRTLDVGCGSGQFVKAMCDAGYDAIGVDLGEQNKIFARDNLGVEVLNQNFLTMKGNFDIVTMHQLIEHVPNPNDFILQAKSLLARDGLLILSTPNLSFARKLAALPRPILGDALGHPPNHCVLFEPSGMRLMLRNHGIIVKSINNNPTGLMTTSKIRRIADIIFNATKVIGPNMIITGVADI